MHIAVFLLCAIFVDAAYLENVPRTLTQPDGVILHCFATGDEYYNRLHNREGYTIIQDSYGWYVYAERDGDTLVPTKVKVDMDIPSYLQPNIMPSDEYIKAKREIMQEYKKFSVNSKPANSLQATPIYTDVNHLVIFVKFPDPTQSFTHNIGYYRAIYNDSNYSLKDYYDESSFGQLEITSHFEPTQPTSGNVAYVTVQHLRNYYEPYSGSNLIGYNGSTERFVREQALIAEIVDSLNAGSGAYTSLNLDDDNDGYIDAISFVFTGEAGTDILWPHMWTIYLYQYSQYGYTQNDFKINGKTIGNYFLYTDGFYGTANWIPVVAKHEFAHMLIEALDLYTNDTQVPVDKWSIMANSYVGMGQYFLMYERERYGRWVDVPSISADGTYTLHPTTSDTNNCYKIPTSDTNQFIYVEYKQTQNEFLGDLSQHVSPTSGLLVYRVNKSNSGNYEDYEVYVYRPGGAYGSGYGSYVVGNVANALRTQTNNPSLTSAQLFLSNGTPLGKTITNIVDNGNGTMSFTLGTPPPPIFPAFSGGNGTEQNPYLISTKQDLWDLTNFVNASQENAEATSGKYFLQTANIYLNNSTDKIYNLDGVAGNESNFMPIGTDESASSISYNFKGRYNGNSHIVDGIIINHNSTANGFVGNLIDGVIMYLGITNCSITGNGQVGAIAGYNNGTIRNCYATGAISSSNTYTGGIAGLNYDGGIIMDCYSRCSVNGSGGYIGGFTGLNYLSTVAFCYSTGTVTGTGQYIGGFIGRNESVANSVQIAYYLNTAYTSSSAGTARTNTQMTATNFVTTLNSGRATISWKFDTTIINSGYPLLEWQPTIVIVLDTITTSVTPTNAGVVSGGGIVTRGDTLTLNATANNGYHFVNWTEGGTQGTSNNPYSFVANGNRNIVANFAIDSFTITLHSNGGFMPNDSVLYYTHISNKITLPVAVAKNGYTFSGWYDNASFAGAAVTDIPTGSSGNKEFWAKWTITEYTIIYHTNGGNNVSQGTYTIEDSVVLPTTYRLGYDFIGWYDNASLKGDVMTILSIGSSGNKEFWAKWATSQYTITATSGENGTIEPSGVQTVDYGSYITFSFHPDEGYELDELMVDGEIVTPIPSNYTFDYIQANHTIDITFKEIPPNKFYLTLQATPSNGGTSIGGGSYDSASMVSITATANSGWSFVNWTENGTEIASTKSADITMNKNRTIVANFEKNASQKYIISVSLSDENAGSIVGAGEYDSATTCELAATANSGYEFVNWMEDDEIITSENPYSFEVASDRTIVANFKQSVQIGNVESAEVVSYDTSNAVLSAMLLSLEEPNELELGFVYAKNNPSYTNGEKVLSDNTLPGSFTCSITGLTPNTTYYARAFVRNSAGIAYSDEISWTTNNTSIEHPNNDFSITLSPNPASAKATLTAQGIDGECNVEVLDINGVLLKNIATNANNGVMVYTLDLSGYANGTYIIRVKDKSVKLIIRK